MPATRAGFVITGVLWILMGLFLNPALAQRHRAGKVQNRRIVRFRIGERTADVGRRVEAARPQRPDRVLELRLPLLHLRSTHVLTGL